MKDDTKKFKQEQLSNVNSEEQFNKLPIEKQEQIKEFYELLLNIEFIDKAKKDPRQALTDEGFNIPKDTEIKLIKMQDLNDLPQELDVIYIPSDLMDPQRNQVESQGLPDEMLEEVIGGRSISDTVNRITTEPLAKCNRLTC